MKRPKKQAGSLLFDDETGQWRAARLEPPAHVSREEVRKRALRDGFHAGFIQGWGWCFVFIAVVEVIFFGTRG